MALITHIPVTRFIPLMKKLTCPPTAQALCRDRRFRHCFANIVLHSFDVTMTRAGYRLIRYADDFIITTRTEAEAQTALALAGRKLAELRLQLNPDKTRILRFERGLEFLGYKFDPFLLTATPPPTATQPPIRLLLNKAPAAMAELPSAIAGLKDKAAPRISQLASQAKQQAGRVGRWFKRSA